MLPRPKHLALVPRSHALPFDTAQDRRGNEEKISLVGRAVRALGAKGAHGTPYVAVHHFYWNHVVPQTFAFALQNFSK